jgi:hypothetical protein
MAFIPFLSIFIAKHKENLGIGIRNRQNFEERIIAEICDFFKNKTKVDYTDTFISPIHTKIGL